MRRFYNYHLVDGLPPDAALRRAQLWLRDATRTDFNELTISHIHTLGRYTDTAVDHVALDRFKQVIFRPMLDI
jgi:hypothetical protein